VGQLFLMVVIGCFLLCHPGLQLVPPGGKGSLPCGLLNVAGEVGSFNCNFPLRNNRVLRGVQHDKQKGSQILRFPANTIDLKNKYTAILIFTLVELKPLKMNSTINALVYLYKYFNIKCSEFMKLVENAW
jgi:hypothetical protein